MGEIIRESNDAQGERSYQYHARVNGAPVQIRDAARRQRADRVDMKARRPRRAGSCRAPPLGPAVLVALRVEPMHADAKLLAVNSGEFDTPIVSLAVWRACLDCVAFQQESSAPDVQSITVVGLP